MMANHADSVGTYASVGRSAAWDPDGALLAEADGTEHLQTVAVIRAAILTGARISELLKLRWREA